MEVEGGETGDFCEAPESKIFIDVSLDEIDDPIDARDIFLP
jgi:hypothetical protein